MMSRNLFNAGTEEQVSCQGKLHKTHQIMAGTEDQVLYYKGRISRLTSLIMRHSFNKGPKDQELNVNIPSGTVILLQEDQRNMAGTYSMQEQRNKFLFRVNYTRLIKLWQEQRTGFYTTKETYQGSHPFFIHSLMGGPEEHGSQICCETPFHGRQTLPVEGWSL